MNTEYTAVIKEDGDWWIGWVEEILGVNCQERSKEKLMESLKEVLKEALELNRKEAIDAAGRHFFGRTACCMKHSKLLKHLRDNGCEMLREGSRHSWWHIL